jgi:Ca2+-binding RTX toxin-like protein
LRNGSKIYGNDGTDNIKFAKTTTSLNIQGGAQNDTIVGGTVGDTLNGGADNDSINGGTGVDTISGSSGDDVITGDAGDDDLDGGIGNDTFNYADAEFTTNEIVNGGTGTNGILLTADAQTLADANFANKTFIDTITTANGINSITLGTTAAATLTAGAKVTGGTAKDTIDATSLGEALIIDGGGGTNILIGSAKADSITSGDGKDTITGLAGSDTITAGTAADTIIYTAKDQGGAAVDAASDNVLNGGDTINAYLSGTDIINVTAALTGAAGASEEAAKDSVDFTGHGFTGIEETDTLNYVAGTTKTSAVATALGKIKGDKDDIAYIGIMNSDKDEVNVFQVFLSAANATALALGTGDEIAHVGTFDLTAVSTMGDWVATAVSA